MAVPLLEGLAAEKVVVLRRGARLPFSIEGVVRLVDPRGRTLALLLDRETLEELREEMESSTPGFLASLEESRRSGRIPGKEVKRKAGIK